MNEGFTKESLTGCLHDFGNTICSRAEKIADLAILRKTRSLTISINIDVGSVPNMSICFDQFADEIRIPWESECNVDRLHNTWGEYMSEIKDSGDRTEFGTGAVRDMHEGKGRMDLLPWNAIMEVSRHCENGAKKYGENNIRLGVPLHSLIDSGLRHTAKFIAGQTDEPHLVAACWNLLWALEFSMTRPDMVDVPWKHPIVRKLEEIAAKGGDEE